MLAEESKSICKFCCSEMSQEHSSCAQCGRVQKLGGMFNGDRFYFLLAAFFALLIVHDMEILSKDFNDFSTQITNSYVSQSELKDGKYIIVFKVANSTGIPWHQIKYQLIGKTNEKVSYVLTNEMWQWWVEANSHAYLTVTLDNNPKISQWDLKIKDLSVKDT